MKKDSLELSLAVHEFRYKLTKHGYSAAVKYLADQGKAHLAEDIFGRISAKEWKRGRQLDANF